MHAVCACYQSAAGRGSPARLLPLSQPTHLAPGQHSPVLHQVQAWGCLSYLLALDKIACLQTRDER